MKPAPVGNVLSSAFREAFRNLRSQKEDEEFRRKCLALGLTPLEPEKRESDLLETGRALGALGVLVLLWAIPISLAAGAIYVIVHFIVKYW
jgi:hypothetical protein